MCFITLTGTAQVRTIFTSKDQELLGKYNNFWLIDDATGFALGKDLVKYERGNEAQQVYFTKVPTDVVGLSKKLMTINASDNSTEAFFCFSYIPEEKVTAFARRRFLNSKYNAYWEPEVIMDNEFILKHQHSGLYLKVTEEGEYKYYKNKNEASRWTLIYL